MLLGELHVTYVVFFLHLHLHHATLPRQHSDNQPVRRKWAMCARSDEESDNRKIGRGQIVGSDVRYSAVTEFFSFLLTFSDIIELEVGSSPANWEGPVVRRAGGNERNCIAEPRRWKKGKKAWIDLVCSRQEVLLSALGDVRDQGEKLWAVLYLAHMSVRFSVSSFFGGGFLQQRSRRGGMDR